MKVVDRLGVGMYQVRPDVQVVDRVPHVSEVQGRYLLGVLHRVLKGPAHALLGAHFHAGMMSSPLALPGVGITA